MRKVGYARVSSAEQANNTNALEQQIERLRTAGALEILVDVESGWKSKERPQLDKLMGMVRSGQVDEVIVTRLDRLSRKGLQSFQIFEQFLNAEVVLRALDEPFDLTTAAGRAMAGQLVVFAQFHSDQKAESIVAGWEHLRNRKIAVNPPFGYCKVEGRHQLDYRPFLCLIKGKIELSKAEIARQIVDAYLTKKSLRLALREINERFSIQTFAHNNAPGEKKKGGRVAHEMFRFSPGGLSNWLTNPVLRGHLPYLRKDNKRTEIYYDTHPDQRLILDEEFREIEKLLAHNKQVRGYGSTALKYPCSGLVFCAECRSSCYSLNGARNYHRAKRLGIPVERNYYFQCKNWRLRACGNKEVIRMEVVEEAVIASLTARASVIADIAESEVTPNPNTPQILQLENQIQQLRLILEKHGNNPAIELAITQIQSQITELRFVSDQEKKIDSASRDLLLWAFSDPDCWREASVEDRQRIYRELVQAVIINHAQVVEVKLKI